MNNKALISCCFNPLLSGQDSLHTEAGPKPKLNPRSNVNKEEKGKFLHAASGAADYIPTINLINAASEEYLNGKRMYPKLRQWTLRATVDLVFAFCI